MGKKKKGGNKMARMSDEERARYLQHRADLEEEARRRKQQLISLYMKNKLKREDAFTRLNIAKINQEWRTLLRQLKCDELKEDIKSVGAFCCEALDRKNQAIRRLLGDLDEAEEFYANLLNAHMEGMNRLSRIYTERLKFWSNWYMTEKASMIAEFNDQMADHRSRTNDAQDNLECIYYSLEQEIKVDEAKIDSAHLKRMDNFRSSMTIRLEEVIKAREQVMEQLWQAFQTMLSDYVAYTKDFHEDYLELKRRDEADTAIIQSHYAEVARCTTVIVNLRLTHNSLKLDYELNTRYLLEMKMSLQKRYFDIKSRLTMAAKRDKENIRQLVVLSSGSLNYLKKVLKEGNTLIQLAAICRKLETDKEKIIPLLADAPNYTLATDAERLRTPVGDFTTTTYNNLAKMENFWVRYNRARLDCACLLEEKSNLEAQNKALKVKLRQYLVQMQMNSSVGAKQRAANIGDRPKSMKIEKMEHIDLTQQRRQLTTKEKLRQRPATCIEGNLSNAIRSHRIVQRPFIPADIYPNVSRI